MMYLIIYFAEAAKTTLRWPQAWSFASICVITDSGERQIWLAATGRNEAVDRVLDAIPEGWTASLVQRELGRTTPQR